MSRRQKVVIGIILFLLILLALAWFFLRPQVTFVTEVPFETVVNTPSAGGLVNGRAGTNVNRATNQPTANVNAAPPPPPPPDERTNLKRIAAAFAERFGSFSNQSDYENIVELRVLMTDAMASWADAYVDEQRRTRAPSAVYFGITTRALTTDATLFNEAAGTATVTVKTQRREEGGEGGAKTYYQDIIIDFEEVGDVWKVDSAVWQPL